jgi:hypothetical protein
MARAGVAHETEPHVDLRVRDRGHLAELVPAGELGQRLEQGARLEAGRRQRAQGAAQLAHGRRGGEPAPDDVPDDDGDRLPGTSQNASYQSPPTSSPLSAGW